MCNFVSCCVIFLGLGGHDCRSPRKLLDEARMKQGSNSLIFVLGVPGFLVRARLLCQDARWEQMW